MIVKKLIAPATCVVLALGIWIFTERTFLTSAWLGSLYLASWYLGIATVDMLSVVVSQILHSMWEGLMETWTEPPEAYARWKSRTTIIEEAGAVFIILHVIIYRTVQVYGAWLMMNTLRDLANGDHTLPWQSQLVVSLGLLVIGLGLHVRLEKIGEGYL